MKLGVASCRRPGTMRSRPMVQRLRSLSAVVFACFAAVMLGVSCDDRFNDNPGFCIPCWLEGMLPDGGLIDGGEMDGGMEDDGGMLFCGPDGGWRFIPEDGGCVEPVCGIACIDAGEEDP